MSDIALIRFEGFELDPRSRSLTLEGKLIALSPKSFDLLLYLAEHPHEVVSKDRLLSAVWPDSFVEESNLSQHVFLVRKALAASGHGEGHGERIVITVPGKGYQFAAPVEVVPPMLALREMPVQESPALYREPTDTGGLLLHSVRSTASFVIEEEVGDLPAGEGRLGLPGPAATRHWLRWWVGSACVVLLGVGGYAGWRWLHPPVVGQVHVVLATIENATHDKDFDRTLNEALEIDLEQSPYLNLLSAAAISETLTTMQKPIDSLLLPGLAREVCERNNAEVILSGMLSQMGSRYLLLLTAESCVSGKEIAAERAEAVTKEGVLGALDSAARKLRQQLGETGASVERFQIPVARATTSSLDALRAYSQGSESFERGDMKAAENSLERAIELDPTFASAYRLLGSTYYERCDNASAAQYFSKAFALRERTTERERLAIEIYYFGYGLNDLEESIRRTRQFLEVYPNDSGSWGWTNLANLYIQLGEYPQAIDAGEHALTMDPHSAAAAQVLARAYKQANRFADARRVADASIAEGKDLWLTHSILFHIANAEGDGPGMQGPGMHGAGMHGARMQADGEWGLTHLNSAMTLDDLGLAAATGGRLQEAIRDFKRARDESLRNGDHEYADGVLLDEASTLAEYGEGAKAIALLNEIKSPMGEPGDVVFHRVVAGDAAAGQRFVAEAGVNERDTVKVFIDLPLVRALLALEAHHPEEAVRLLEPAKPYELRDYRVPYLRAQAEAEAGRVGVSYLDASAADYRLILEHRGVDPIAPVYTLTHLRLARILVRQKHVDAAKAEYRALFDAWKGADADLPLLVEARAEYARL